MIKQFHFMCEMFHLRLGCIKYLRVLKDENLSWRKHIVTVASKISKTIGMLSKLRHFIPSSVLVNIYNALITAYMVLSLGETPVKRISTNTYPSKTCTTINIFCKQTGSCYSFTCEC